MVSAKNMHMVAFYGGKLEAAGFKNIPAVYFEDDAEAEMCVKDYRRRLRFVNMSPEEKRKERQKYIDAGFAVKGVENA